ncbi:MAG: hypothetical protein MRK02_08540 [Candidatus Scalindua sp.]|nr:hypothetical protein [Candidatus Scalindua sp.]
MGYSLKEPKIIYIGEHDKWSLNIDGIIGTGAELKNKLTTPGTRLVRLAAIDSVGESSFKEHTINVNPSTDGCPPSKDCFASE